MQKKYSELLRAESKNHVLEAFSNNHSFLKYSILVNNRDDFFEKAERSRISLGDWFTSPIHPISSDFHKWHFEYGNYPNAGYCSEKLVNLPTDISPRQTNAVLMFLRDNLDYIVNY